MEGIEAFSIGREKPRRTLTTAQKRDLIEERGNRCQLCGKKFPSRLLHVHHLRPLSRSDEKRPLFDFSFWKNDEKPAYDRKSNLVVLCPTCHTKVHAGLVPSSKLKKKTSKKGKKKARKKRKRAKEDWELEVPEIEVPDIKLPDL